MNDAIVTTNGRSTALVYDPEQVALIKQMIAPGATDNELALFIQVCQRTGLDALSRQIYMIERRTKDKAGNWQRKMVIQTGIDGYRVTAERSGRLDGMLGPFWCGDDGAWRDVWLDTKPPRAAKVGILRRGCREPFWGVATMAEFRPGAGQDAMWQRMPAGQLAKCAEAQAMRRAFPNDLSGLTTPETDLSDAIEAADAIDATTARLIEQHDTARQARGRGEWVEEIDVAPRQTQTISSGQSPAGRQVGAPAAPSGGNGAGIIAGETPADWPTDEDLAKVVAAEAEQADAKADAEAAHWTDRIAEADDALGLEAMLAEITESLPAGYHRSGALALALIRLIDMADDGDTLDAAGRLVAKYRGSLVKGDAARVKAAGAAGREALARVMAVDA